MPTSGAKCVKCGGSSFELSGRTSVQNAKYDYYFVRCTSCSTAVNTVEFFNIGAELQDVKKQIAELQKAVKAIARSR